jgi:hypothetical protein
MSIHTKFIQSYVIFLKETLVICCFLMTLVETQDYSTESKGSMTKL